MLRAIAQNCAARGRSITRGYANCVMRVSRTAPARSGFSTLRRRLARARSARRRAAADRLLARLRRRTLQAARGGDDEPLLALALGARRYERRVRLVLGRGRRVEEHLGLLEQKVH